MIKSLIKLVFIFFYPIIFYTQLVLSNDLLTAIQQENTELLRTLLDERTLDVSTPSSIGNIALRVAASNCYVEGMDALLNAGADPNVNSRNNSPLMLAILSKCTKGTELLLSWDGSNYDYDYISDKIDPNALTSLGNTPLRVAASNCYIEGMRALLNAGADPSVTNNVGNPPLMSATSNKCTEGMDLLLSWDSSNYDYDYISNKVDPNYQNLNGDTAFMSLVVGRHTPALELLIKAEGDINLPNHKGITPLMLAISRGDIEVMQALLDHGADPYIVNADDENSLLVAIREDQIEALSLLLDIGMDPNDPNQEGNTAFMLAASIGNTAVMQTLLDHGADPHAVNTNNENALFAAARDGHAGAVHFLLGIGVNHNIANREDQTTPLMVAVDHRTETLESRIFERFNDSRLPRSPAENYIPVITLLLAARAEVNAVNRNEVTPLMIATAEHDIEIARLLLVYDDNPGYTNSRGYSALRIATLNGDEEIAQLIQAAIDEAEAQKEETEEEQRL